MNFSDRSKMTVTTGESKAGNLGEFFRILKNLISELRKMLMEITRDFDEFLLKNSQKRVAKQPN